MQFKKFLIKHRLLIIILVIYGVSLIQGYRRVGGEIDEGYIISMGSLFAKGYVPYRDFNLIYGPMGVWIIGYLFKIFGASVVLERTVGASYQLLFIISSYLIGFRRSRAIGFICGLIIEIFFISGTYGGIGALPWIGGMAFAVFMILLISLLRDDRISTKPTLYFSIGAVASISLLFRFDFLITIFPILVMVFFKTAKNFRKYLVAGSSLTLLGYIVQGAFSGYSRLYFVFVVNPRIQAPGNHLPIPPNSAHLSSFFDVMDMLFSRPSWFIPQLSFPMQIVVMFYVVCFISLLLLAIAFYTVLRRKQLKPEVYALIILELGTVPYAFERADSTHILSTLVLGFVAIAAIIGDMAPLRAGVIEFKYINLAVLILLLVVVIPTYYLAPAVNEVETSVGITQNQNTSVSNLGRTYYVQDSATSSYLMSAMREVDSVAGKNSSLFVGTPNLRIIPINDAFLYYLFPQLHPSSKYILLYPAIGQYYPQKLKEAIMNANIVVTDAFAYSWSEPNTSVIMNPPEPAQVFAADFCLLHSYGGFSIYVNRYYPPAPLKNRKFTDCRAPYYTAFY